MAKTWNSYNDAQAQADLVRQIIEQGHILPDVLVASIKASLQTARPGLVQEFYGKLAEGCPAAIKYFTEESE